MNKKYAVFGVAAVVAIAGVIYFGTSANQQASVAALKSSAKTDLIKPIRPTGGISDELAWRRLCRDGAGHIQVLSPNGGEVYQAGQQITVKWRSCNIDQSTFIDFDLVSYLPTSNGYTGGREIGSSAVNDGTETITLPNIPANEAGKYFKVKIYPMNQPTPTLTIVDDSNDAFTINSNAGLTTVLNSSTTNVTRDAMGNVVQAQVATDFKMTANGSDFYVPRVVKSGTSLTDTVVGDKGFVTVVLTGNSIFDSVATSVSSVSIISGATVDGSGKIRIDNGSTAVLRVTTIISAPVGSGRKMVQLNAVGAATTTLGAVVSYPTLPATAYRSGFTPAF